MKKIFKRVITGVAVLTTAATMFVGNGVSANCSQGDVNLDGVINIRDAACISTCLAKNDMTAIKGNGDYNTDGKTDIRDAAAIAKKMSTKTITCTVDLNKLPEEILANCPIDKIADCDKCFGECATIAEASCRPASVINGGLICDGFFNRYQIVSEEESLYLCIDVELSHLTYSPSVAAGRYVSNVETERVFGWAEVRAISTHEYELTMLGWDYTCCTMSEDMKYFLQNYSPDQFYFAEGMEVLEGFF